MKPQGNMCAIKIILAGGILIFLAAVLGVGYIFFIRPLTLPVYHRAQLAFEHSRFVATTLTLGDAVYISDDTEVPLEMTAAWVGKNAMIGRTDDGMEVYAIPQQDPRNYIMLTTFMFPSMIFRNSSIPPVRLSSFQVDEIQLVENPGANSPHQNREAAIIDEAAGCLIRRAEISPSGEIYKSANIRLISDQLPGLAYMVYVFEKSDGKIFLAERSTPDDWIPAGPAFTDWAHQLPLKLAP